MTLAGWLCLGPPSSDTKRASGNLGVPFAFSVVDSRHRDREDQLESFCDNMGMLAEGSFCLGSLAVKTKDLVIFWPTRGESQLAAVDNGAHRENAI